MSGGAAVEDGTREALLLPVYLEPQNLVEIRSESHQAGLLA